ncbi:sugar ABC transporter ATP-binding protein [Alkalibaculum sporogenes]|uniref:sugar ABC transporter ATP-binding protein n=1 Tax=Alkalibaculum sporogenes TaxID=2655001 RepID=UPI001FE25B7A|nr:sugar ABC transporter ATP-binding protein [Alkalibaculum sporogenes]
MLEKESEIISEGEYSVASISEYQVEMCNISKSFAGVKALVDVTLKVKAGEIHALIGENGAGKSTLMKILAGAQPQDKGTIKIGGREVKIKNPKDGLENGISVIYQEISLIPDVSVMENIFLDEFNEKKNIINWKDLKVRAKKYLDDLGFGEIDVSEKVKNLSVAYQQIVEICKALNRKSTVLVLDEPTAVLTMKEVEKLFELLNQLRDEGVSIIYISHRLDEVFSLTDRITVLKDGNLVNTVESQSINEDELVRMMIGRNLDTFFPERKTSMGKVVLSVKNLKAGNLVKDISFEVRSGEVLGLSGLVGAGRTEAVMAMLGIDNLDGGIVELDGKKIKFKSAKDAFKHKIGLLPEDRKSHGVLLNMPIKHNITLTCLNNFSTASCINLKKERSFVNQFSNEVGIKAASLDNNVSSLSGGNQQKVALAKLLAAHSRILILDEPTRGVDVGSKTEIFKLINDMVEKKCAVIMISSEMTEIIGMCDRVIVIREGVSVGELQKEELSEINLIKYAMGVTKDESKQN